MIKLSDITKKYGDKTVFDKLNLEIAEHEVTAILGASGVGKTTLLNIIAGNADFSGSAEGISGGAAYVYQEDRLLPFLTVNKNLCYALGKGDYDKELEKVGLDGCGKMYPGELSGGMARRVSILRAFLFNKNIILMDEPFSGLDVGVKYKIMDAFKKMWQADRRTVIIVTHDAGDALFLAKKVVVLGDKGKILLNEDNAGAATLEKITKIFMND